MPRQWQSIVAESAETFRNQLTIVCMEESLWYTVWNFHVPFCQCSVDDSCSLLILLWTELNSCCEEVSINIFRRDTRNWLLMVLHKLFISCWLFGGASSCTATMVLLLMKVVTVMVFLLIVVLVVWEFWWFLLVFLCQEHLWCFCNQESLWAATMGRKTGSECKINKKGWAVAARGENVGGNLGPFFSYWKR